MGSEGDTTWWTSYICTGLIRNMFHMHLAWFIFLCSRILGGCSHIGPISSCNDHGHRRGSGNAMKLVAERKTRCGDVGSLITHKMSFRRELAEMLWRHIGHPQSLWQPFVYEFDQELTKFLAWMKIRQGHAASTESNPTSSDKSSFACHNFYLFLSTNED